MSNKLFDGVIHSKGYALFRPVPPKSIVLTIMSFLKQEKGQTAIDVGCGSGQSTLVLAPHFQNVIGMDISKTQIAEAKSQLLKLELDNVEFRLSGADRLPFDDGKLDLVTICQAIHWLNVEDFYAEVNRTLRPGGVLAVYGYHLTGPAPHQEKCEELQNIRNWIFDDILGKYWNPERKLVDDGYHTLPPMIYKDFVRDDSHHVEVEGSLADFAGYVESWSAFQNFKKKCGEIESKELISTFISKCQNVLCNSSPPNEIPLFLRTNYFLLMGRKPSK